MYSNLFHYLQWIDTGLFLVWGCQEYGCYEYSCVCTFLHSRTCLGTYKDLLGYTQELNCCGLQDFIDICMFMSRIVYVQLRTGLLKTGKMPPLVPWVSFNSNSIFRRAFSNPVTPYASGIIVCLLYLAFILLSNLNDFFSSTWTRYEPIFKSNMEICIINIVLHIQREPQVVIKLDYHHSYINTWFVK